MGNEISRRKCICVVEEGKRLLFCRIGKQMENVDFSGRLSERSDRLLWVEAYCFDEFW